MAESRLNAYLSVEGKDLPLSEYKQGDKVIPYKVIGSYKGSELVGIHYHQLMPWVKPSAKLDNNAAEFVTRFAEAHPENVFTSENGKERFVEMSQEAFRVIPGDYVTTEDGAGIVHSKYLLF